MVGAVGSKSPSSRLSMSNMRETIVSGVFVPPTSVSSSHLRQLALLI